MIVLSLSLILLTDAQGQDKGKSDDPPKKAKGKSDDPPKKAKGKSEDPPKKGEGKSHVVGCITSVTVDAKDKTVGTVVFEHRKFGKNTVKVDKDTKIEICEEVKTLVDLEAAVKKAADPKAPEPPYCGMAKVNNLTDLKALRISVCNTDDD
ncbi:MAG: hypothetical protein L0Z62_17550 [Gemmataceae bacterium]|nr:hypothetical protein [Gemmataceae bacterium]